MTDDEAAAGRDRIVGNSTGFTEAGPGDATSLELSVDELSLDERAGGASFCADDFVGVDYKNKNIYVVIKIVIKQHK